MIWEIPFWISLVFWALLPATQTPWFDLDSLPIDSKEALLVIVAIFYFFIIRKSVLLHTQNAWNFYLPSFAMIVSLYATVSIAWSGLNSEGAISMLYTVILTISSFFLGYLLIIGNLSYSRIQSFLWTLTVFLAAISLVYFAESFFSLGLRSSAGLGLNDFGIQRLKGPLFSSATGHFILIPALSFALQIFLNNQHKASALNRLFQLGVIFSITVAIIGLGSRAALIILFTFFLLVALLQKGIKQRIVSIAIMVSILSLVSVLVFSRADTARLSTIEDQGRAYTHFVSFQIASERSVLKNIFGSGYGSYWAWYITNSESARPGGASLQETGLILQQTPYGLILYHPHSTFLLFFVEMGGVGLIFFGLFLWVLIQTIFSKSTDKQCIIFACGVSASGLSLFFDFFIFKGSLINAIWWIFFFGFLALQSTPQKQKYEEFTEVQNLILVEHHQAGSK